MIDSKERYSYIVLVVMSLIIAIVAVTLSLKQVHKTTFNFCQLVAISNEHPVHDTTSPSSPAQLLTQRAEAMYAEYKLFGAELGCNQ